MKIRSRISIATLCSFFVLFSPSVGRAESSETVLPSVSRRIITCDAWQWIGGAATTWGCLYTPREIQVAGGQITDDVVLSLQKQMSDLEARLKKLERANR